VQDVVSFHGEVVIQTYQPEHYAVTTAATEDYVGFYEQEMNYRRLMKYPPAAHIMAILIQSKEEEVVVLAADLLAGAVKEWLKAHGELFIQDKSSMSIIGPAPAGIAKMNDIYRRVLYLKEEQYEYLVEVKDFLEQYITVSEYFKKCNVQFDFDPMNSY